MPFFTSGTPNIKGLEDKIEELHRSLKKKWWEKTWIQAITFIGTIICIIVALYGFFK